MLTYPNIDPVALSLGPLKIHWYGITYLVAFVGGWWLARYRARKPGSGWTEDEVADVVFYIALGVIVGGRVGSVLFYNTDQFLQNPLIIFQIWNGGMSFHGGFLGVIVAFYLYARKTGRSFFQVADFLAPMFPLGLGAGRIGNFINGELWGRVTDVPWGMIVPAFQDGLPRHPNQLYQFFCEGVILFAIVWFFSRKPRPTMAVSGMFVLCYGIYRFLIEFVRQPDEHLGFVAFDWMTMGQVLSLPMIIVGGALLFLSRGRPLSSAT
ncbi:MAG: prolipoprotein diacylglyceryl transferase [Granulosicoccus sp.]|nr:prolipoprotein diacylglyceryl transferase [Granulosicoccus sp.]